MTGFIEYRINWKVHMNELCSDRIQIKSKILSQRERSLGKPGKKFYAYLAVYFVVCLFFFCSV